MTWCARGRARCAEPRVTPTRPLCVTVRASSEGRSRDVRSVLAVWPGVGQAATQSLDLLHHHRREPARAGAAHVHADADLSWLMIRCRYWADVPSKHFGEPSVQRRRFTTTPSSVSQFGSPPVSKPWAPQSWSVVAGRARPQPEECPGERADPGPVCPVSPPRTPAGRPAGHVAGHRRREDVFCTADSAVPHSASDTAARFSLGDWTCAVGRPGAAVTAWATLQLYAVTERAGWRSPESPIRNKCTNLLH